MEYKKLSNKEMLDSFFAYYQLFQNLVEAPPPPECPPPNEPPKLPPPKLPPPNELPTPNQCLFGNYGCVQS